MRRKIHLAVLLVSPLPLAGCYDVSVSGTSTTITLAFWIRLLTLLIPAAMVLALAFLWLIPRRFPTLRLVSRILSVIGIAVLLLPSACCVPGMWTDVIVITPERLTRATGFWFSPTTATVDLRETAFIVRESYTNPAGQTRSHWVAHLRSGGTVPIPPGDLGDAAEADVRTALRANGVDFR
jgi:hypothetical protein